MSIVVGYGPEARGNGALDLARMLADSSGQPLAVCCVIPERWEPVSVARSTDAEFERHLGGLAGRALERARQALAACSVEVSFELVTARSAPAGLLEAVERHGAALLVVGSSADGAWGHIALGSVTDRLLHSSPVPVAVAPRGHRSPPGTRVGRVTVALDGTDGSRAVLERADRVAKDVGASLRVVSFAVRTRTMYPPETGLHAEDQVVAAWREQSRAAIDAAIAALPDHSQPPEALVVEAESWAEVLDEPPWQAGDVLVVGSSASQPMLSRVFLGSTAARIVRHSPVPVVVVN